MTHTRGTYVPENNQIPPPPPPKHICSGNCGRSHSGKPVESLKLAGNPNSPWVVNFSYAKVRDVKSPMRGTVHSAGIDFFVPNDLTYDQLLEKNKQTHSNFNWIEDTKNIIVLAHNSILIPSGLHIHIPHGYMMMLGNKSGVAVKKAFDVCGNIIDSDYQGEFCFHVINTTAYVQTIELGEKLVQGLIVPILQCDIVEKESVSILYQDHISERKTGGFGSTGTK